MNLLLPPAQVVLSRTSSFWRVRVGENVRARHQAQSQERAENCVECKAEAGPPRGDAGVCNEEVVDEVKDAVAHQGSDYEPGISFEAENGEQGESEGDSDFDPEGALRSAHHGKQDVVGGDDDEEGGIEGAVAVQADEGGEAGDGEREQQADQVFHWGASGEECSAVGHHDQEIASGDGLGMIADRPAILCRKRCPLSSPWIGRVQ